MRNLLQQNRKGVSLMIGYVLLIIIAVGISIAVFTYLKLYLPKEEPKCQEDIVLSIDEVICENGEVEISISNRGLFSVNGAFIRIGEVDRVAKTLLNNGPVLFIDQNDGLLGPGESWNAIYNDDDYEDIDFIGIKELEIEPLVYVDNKPALCEKAVVTQRISCS